MARFIPRDFSSTLQESGNSIENTAVFVSETKNASRRTCGVSKRCLPILENVGSLAKVSPTKRKPYRAAYVGYTSVAYQFAASAKAQSRAAQACDYTPTHIGGGQRFRRFDDRPIRCFRLLFQTAWRPIFPPRTRFPSKTKSKHDNLRKTELALWPNSRESTSFENSAKTASCFKSKPVRKCDPSVFRTTRDRWI